MNIKGGESLPLTRTTLLATPSSGAKIIPCLPRNAPKFLFVCTRDSTNSRNPCEKLSQIQF